MKNKYFKLVQVIGNFDITTNKDILIFVFSPVDIQNNFYHFVPDSDENISIIYESSVEIENYYMSQKDEFISINLNDFDYILRKEGTKIFKTYLEKKYSILRQNKIFWHGNAKENIENSKQIAFIFSHCQCAFYDFGPNHNDNNYEIILNSFSELNLLEETNIIIIDKKTVTFCFMKENNVFTRIKGKIETMTFDNKGRIKKIEALSVWAGSKYHVFYEFDVTSNKFLERSEKNAIITVLANDLWEPYIKVQWSLLFGKNEGIVKFS